MEYSELVDLKTAGVLGLIVLSSMLTHHDGVNDVIGFPVTLRQAVAFR
jgi:hypothetical protein